MGRLDGKVAILSGGGRGIGRATVEMMVAEGAKVTFTDINVENGQAVADSLGDNAMFIEQDVTDSASWPKVVAATKERFGLINVLVNNVGWVTLDDADIEHESDEGWRNIIAINMDSVFYACRTIVPEMREAGGGSIVNISSMAGKLGTPSMVAYGAAESRCLGDDQIGRAARRSRRGQNSLQFDPSRTHPDAAWLRRTGNAQGWRPK